jgi:uncharacterized protein (UPF0332 family)
LKSHSTSKQEIYQLWDIIERDIKDASNHQLSSDWRFGIAYNAALKLCTILLYSEGFRPDKSPAHYRTITSLSEILGFSHKSSMNYLNSCRIKRNNTEYSYTGGISAKEAHELIEFVLEYKIIVKDWIKKHHPEFE